MFPCEHIQTVYFLQDVKVHNDNTSDIYHGGWVGMWNPLGEGDSVATPSHYGKHQEHFIYLTYTHTENKLKSSFIL